MQTTFCFARFQDACKSFQKLTSNKSNDFSEVICVIIVATVIPTPIATRKQIRAAAISEHKAIVKVTPAVAHIAEKVAEPKSIPATTPTAAHT